ncbi:adenosylhomocysteinase [Demequina sp.]|uniref:adenosylhomocysteinase n=1 Tax=Demequina sp. TaxID=2050685 RepID=UPI003D0D908F
MASAFDEAESLVRDFARRTNLQLAGRPFRVTRPDAVGTSLRGLLVALGCRELGAGQEAPGMIEFGDGVLLDGVPIPDRGDAAGRIDFAGDHMPAARAIADGLDLSGLSIGVAMMLEPKTANLALLLASAGADVAVYAHPDETDPQVAEALRERGIAVDADASLAGEAERAAALAWLSRGFDVVMDDGSHLIRLAHESAPEQVERWIGACEETTSGLRPLRAMDSLGLLKTPVVAVNDAETKTSFDNRYGTGQSCVFAIADVLDGAGITVRDQPALVIGYGPVGQGVAAHLRALGATVRVAEQDPVRSLLAIHDGYDVGYANLLAQDALVVSATGVRGTVTERMVRIARAVAVAGGVPHEIALDGAEFEPVAPHLDRLGDTLVLDRGGCINITAAEGNPIEIMDLSFATQLAGLEFLLKERPGIGVHPIPNDYVAAVANAALAAREINAAPAPASGSDADWRSARYR